ncbi:tripartite tricarboxylate transporter TctB family protein [Pseudomonas sp. MPC6]|uniref:tripartite tricarboxylate transporter TctB family protein n=1 Tax=unclassified Pseudomonas TaxID=196821 RepID=UPI001110DBFE|nr:tripartite tricarboxylate transporter TctB family protein [Pseudomonas sp. MPC6]QCY09562.1 hypothetical protein ELQ88_01670 [Pseudomonas sp. MPC6]
MLINKKELVVGGGVFASGLLFILFLIPVAVVSPQSIAIAVLDPAFWPKVVSWVLLILGICMMLNIMLNRRSEPHANSFETTSCETAFRMSVFVVFLSGYYLLLPYLGMVWGSSIAYIILSIAFCKTGYRFTAVAVGILLPAALYAFFYHVAGIDIPQSEFARLP